MPEPTRAGRRLAAYLSSLATMGGVPASTIAARTSMSAATVSRVRNGHRLPTRDEALGWCAACSATDAARAEVLALLADAHSANRSWSGDDGPTPDDVQTLVDDLTDGARAVWAFHPVLMPGLLQTPAYATRATETTGHPATDVRVAVAHRMARQRHLYDQGRGFAFLLGDRAWDRDLGDRSILVVQHAHVHSLAAFDHIDVRVLPDAVDTPAMTAFTLYQGRDDDGPDTVTVELPHGLVVLSDPADVAVYRDLFSGLLTRARGV